MAKGAEIRWFGKQVTAKAERAMVKRVKLASQVMRDKVVKNLSKPVTKVRTARGTRVDPASRSKPGEFPRADTTRLMKSIFWKVEGSKGRITGKIATSLFYGAFHETKTGRSFLAKTLKLEKARIKKILAGPRPPIL